MKHMMVDIETLGTEPGAAILSIGACAFGPGEVDEPGNVFYQRVDIKSCQNVGLSIEAGTLQWWIKQDDNARLEALRGEVDVKHALLKLQEYVHRYSPAALWANSPEFDFEHLRRAWSLCFPSAEFPWAYWKQRDHRTIKACITDAQAKLIEVKLRKGAPDGVAHSAKDDAVQQARFAAEAMLLVPAWAGAT